jgi:hypothetical protein
MLSADTMVLSADTKVLTNKILLSAETKVLSAVMYVKIFYFFVKTSHTQ